MRFDCNINNSCNINNNVNCNINQCSLDIPDNNFPIKYLDMDKQFDNYNMVKEICKTNNTNPNCIKNTYCDMAKMYSTYDNNKITIDGQCVDFFSNHN